MILVTGGAGYIGSHAVWALVDAGDVIVHVFRPEVRDYYDLEGMWSVQ